MVEKSSLKFLFHPESIAIAGVSHEPEKIGSVVFNNIIDAGYKGKLYPVNPKHTELFGTTCYPKFTDIPGVLDLVVIAIPAEFVDDVLEDAGKKGAKAAIIISAGFKETGKEGAEREKRLIEIAKKYNIRILGPNCLGIIIPEEGINASFAATNAIQGSAAFLSQSGALCTAILDMSLEKKLGFSHFLSYGNKADINENELIAYWLDDPQINVIGAYIEGITDGQELISLAHTQNNKVIKPIVVLKPGLDEKAAEAMASHTGSLAQDSQFFKTALDQNNFIEAETVEQMFNLILGFSWCRPPKGNKVAIVTNAGGPGIIATDEIHKQGLELAEFSEKTIKKLTEALPPTANVHNPIDVIGDALAERYRVPLNILTKDKDVDSILVILTPQIVTQTEETAELIIKYAEKTDKPIFAVFTGGASVSKAIQKLNNNKVPTFTYINSAIDVLSRMYQYKQKIKINGERKIYSRSSSILQKKSRGKYRSELRQYLNEKEIALPEKLVEKMAKESGLTLPRQKICEDFKEAAKFAKNHYPVVLKATTASITHKTDKSALFLNIQDQTELLTAYDKLTRLVSKQLKKSGMKKTKNIQPPILIQQQLKADQEIFIGAKRDGNWDVYEDETPGFGHLLAFGTGGIYTEVYKDIQYALVPAPKQVIEESFQKAKVYEIVKGARGKKKLAYSGIIKTIQAVQKLVVLYPEISSLDINPLMIDNKRAIVADLKIFIKNSK